MNERFRLDSKAIRAWLKKEDRKQSYLVRQLNVSGSLVAQMLSKEAHVPGEQTLKALASLMGVQERQLLLPREPEDNTKAKTA